MRLTIHRGTDEIGGSCVEVATDRARILLDAGLPLPPLVGEAPKPSLPASLSRTLEGNGPRFDAVFLSHAHGDHSGMVSDLPDDVPVCLSRISSKLLMAGACFAGGRTQLKGREVALEGWSPVCYGDIEVTPIPVDHSIPGAMAFLIESEARRILYSGDLRWHGTRRETIDQMIERLRDRPTDVFLTEGTLIGGEAREVVAESDLAELSARHFLSSDRLALAMFSPQNCDRLLTMIRASTLAGRELVLDPYSLFVLHLMKTEPGMPDPFDPGMPLRVWFPSGRGGGRSGPFKRVWDEVTPLLIEPEEFLESPGSFVLTFRSWMATAFPEILPRTDMAIWAYWAGYERSSRVAELRNRFVSSGIQWIRAHGGGHILPEDLKRLVAELRPRTVVPIHTGHADLFPKLFPDQFVLRLRDGEVFSLS